MPRNYKNQSKIDEDFGWLNNVAKNRDKYTEIDNNTNLLDIAAQAKFNLPPGYCLVYCALDKLRFQIALLCDTSSEIVYFIECVIWEEICLNAKPVTQVLLWRTSVVSHRSVT